jgi:hypothetical protein
MTAEDVFGKHELNVAAAACTNRRGDQSSPFGDFRKQLSGHHFNFNGPCSCFFE